MTPVVSVVIPLFNARRFIGDALGSLVAQTMTDWEAVVVDDGSTDGGHEVVARAACEDPRIRLVRQANAGQSSARNAGIEGSAGRFLVFLDNDDWLMPGALARLVSEAERSAHGAAHGAAAWHDESGAALGWTFDPTSPRIGLSELLAHGRFITASQIVARETLGADRFRPRHDGVEDHDLWLRLATKGVVWSAVGETVCAYRLRATSDSRRYARIARVHSSVLREAFELARASPQHEADCSTQREARVLLRTALHYATATALHDPSPELDRAAAIFLESSPGSCRLSPEDGALAAYWALPYADCRAPSVWSEPGLNGARLSRAAHLWWRRCAELGWADDEFPASARAALARLAVSPELVARRLADSCEPGRPVVVLGLGRQAPPVVRELARRGIAFTARDHAVPPGTRELSVGGETVPTAEAESTFDPRAVHLMTVAEDSSFLARLPSGLSVVRWSDAAAALAGEVERRLSPFWTESPGRGAAA